MILPIGAQYYNRPSEFTGRCTYVYNHQTITVQHGQSSLRVKLYNVGEIRYPSGASMSASQYLSSLVLDETVYVRVTANQGYVGSGSVTGVVYVNGVNVNQKLLDEGYAYRYGQEPEQTPRKPAYGLPPQEIGLDNTGRKFGPERLADIDDDDDEEEEEEPRSKVIKSGNKHAGPRN